MFSIYTLEIQEQNHFGGRMRKNEVLKRWISTSRILTTETIFCIFHFEDNLSESIDEMRKKTLRNKKCRSGFFLKVNFYILYVPAWTTNNSPFTVRSR